MKFCEWLDNPGSRIVILLCECVENCFLYPSPYFAELPRTVEYIEEIEGKWLEDPESNYQTAAIPAW